MGKASKLLIVLLIGNVILGIINYKSLGDLRYQIQNQSYTTRDYEWRLSDIESSIYDISNKIDKIYQESMWISNEKFIPDVEGSNIDEIHLNLEFSFNEVEKDAQIYLLYSIQNSLEWVKVNADKVVEGIYKAPMILSPKEIYEYKIVAQGNTLKTGETKLVPNGMYRPMPVTVRGVGTSGGYEEQPLDSLAIEASQDEPTLFQFFKPIRVQALIYEGEHLERTVDLNIEKGLVWASKDIKFTESPTSIVLEVEYGNGHIDRGEVWPELKYESTLLKQKE